MPIGASMRLQIRRAALAAAPTVTAISPALGNDYGLTSVTLTGTNFTGATGATVNGVAITSFVVVNATTITGVTGSSTASTTARDVIVTSASGSGTGTALYTYYSPFVNETGGIVGYRYEQVALTAGKVNSWTDQFGTNHAVQATAAAQPVYTANVVGGHSALTFAGAQILASPAVGIGAFTTYLSFRASGTAGIIYEQGPNAGAGDGRYLYGTTGATMNVRKGGAQSGKDRAANWSTDNVWRVVAHACDGTHAGHTLHINDAAQTMADQLIGAPGTTTTSDAIYLGARSGIALPITGDMVDFLIFNTVHSATQKTNAYNWLRGRVGL